MIKYNKLLKGATLEGEVIAAENEKVKLHSDIDESQDEGEAYWFDYLPPSVNIMCSMPLVGETARLYFPNEENENPIVTGCVRKDEVDSDPRVTGCVRKNGDACEGTSDTTNRYLCTEHGSEIALLPGALNIKEAS